MSAYRVLIVIKGEWWADNETFRSLHEARRYRRDVVAPRWSDCDTAICSPSNDVLFFRDSILEQQRLAKELSA